MGDWEKLPPELLAHLYAYLSRRDRLSCSLVCSRWKEGLNHVMLWKTLVVYIDRDLMDPSTIFLLRDYCKYMKNLEFGWAVPHRNRKWYPAQHKELTKKAVRFFLILHDSFIQISCLRIFNWFDFASLQKVTYHIARFLKNQISLKRIILDNINMHSPSYIKLLTSCLGSRSTINNLDIKSCYYFQSTFDSVYFRSCIEQLTYLKTFKVDYYILSCNLIESILISGNSCLEYLEVVLKETVWRNEVIDDVQWCLLHSACPDLKVTLIIRNMYHFGELRLYLKESIPVVSLSIALPKVFDTGDHCEFRKILNLLVMNYHKTLETMDLHLKNDSEVLDDILLMILRRCSKLQNFVFGGFLENIQLIKSAFSDVKCFCISPNEFPGKYILFNRIAKDDVSDMKHKRVQFSFQKRDCEFLYSLLILN